MTGTLPTPLTADLLVGGDFILLRMALVDALGGDFPAAILLQRIAWRCERHPDGWRASRADLAAETRLSPWAVRKATKLLEDRGWLVSARADTWDATQVWKVALTSDDGRASRHGESLHIESAAPSTSDMVNLSTSDMVNLSTSDMVNLSTSDMVNLSTSSLEDVETRERRGGEALAASAPRGPAGAPPMRCPRHEGTTHDGACGACGDARRARADWDRRRAEAQDDARTFVPQPMCPVGHGEPAGRCGRCAHEASGPVRAGTLRVMMREGRERG